LLVAADSFGLGVISSSLFDVYGTNNGSGATLDSPLSDGLFVEESAADKFLTDTALRLTPLLNGEELSRLSDSELKEFLRNLPLLSVEGRRGAGHMLASGSAPVTDDSSKTPVPLIEEGDIVHVSAFNKPSEFNGSQTATDRKLIATLGNITEAENAYLASVDADSLATGLLCAINAAGQRGWKLGRLTNNAKNIQGDLQNLRKLQSSRKYSIWQKQD